MRRGSKLLNKSMLFLLFAALFNLVSFTLDQFVVQEEDNLRKVSRNMDNLQTEISTLLNTKNSIKDIELDILSEENLMYEVLDMNTRIITILNDDEFKFTKNLSENKTTELRKTFNNNLSQLVNRINENAKELHLLIDGTLDNQLINKTMKNDQKFLKDILSFRPELIPNDISKNYDLNASIGNDDVNFKTYNSLYDSVRKIYEVSEDINFLHYKLDKIYIETFIQYLYAIDNYASIKNKNNYFILLSIASQILGVTFLLFLFRSLVGDKVND